MSPKASSKPAKTRRKSVKNAASQAEPTGEIVEISESEDSKFPPEALASTEVTTLPVVSGGAALPVAPADRDLLKTYLNEIGKIPLLSADEERALAILAYDEKDRTAVSKLVQANLRFVVKLAFEYARYGAKILDLIQEGNVGLLKAVQDFNPYKDVRLTTYAVWWIRSYMQDYLLKNWSIVRIGTTAAQKKLFYRLKKEQERLEREGIRPEPLAIAAELGVDASDVKMMQERMSGRDVSLTPSPDIDNPSVSSWEAKATDPAPLASSQLEQNEQSALFRQALDEFVEELEERDRAIFEDRLLSENPKTLQEIGESYGVTKERARQIEERVKKRFAEFLAKHYPEISVRE